MKHANWAVALRRMGATALFVAVGAPAMAFVSTASAAPEPDRCQAGDQHTIESCLPVAPEPQSAADCIYDPYGPFYDRPGYCLRP